MESASTEGQSEVENVRVFVRIRPISKKEKSEGHEDVALVDHRENLVALQKDSNPPKIFKFDQIFGEDSTQLSLYRVIAAPIVEKVLQGYNGTIFAYGQTGTGKTFTMAGNHNKTDLKGIIPNTFSHIFSKISNASGEHSFVVTVTYLEIYNEEIRDLLSGNPNQKLAIKQRPDVGVYVKDLMGFTVDSIESITELLNRGNKNRVTRSTLMNDVSSRSHAIFTIIIESKNRKTEKTTVGKLNLVDLAGSERASRTQATGERLKEANSINLSLSVLGNVISALVDAKSTHIPYRNSKLTRLLQDSLGGNSKTAMIAMISPVSIDYDESMYTLRYAARVKHIQNHAKINVEQSGGLIEGFELEIAELQEKISQISLHEETQAKQKRKEKISQSKVEEQKRFEEELEKTEKEKSELTQKISIIQKKILVGGENLFVKAQQQAFLLELTESEIHNLKRANEALLGQLYRKEQEVVDVQEKYSNLHEEAAGISRKTQKVQALLQEVKREAAERSYEYQRELEILQDDNLIIFREDQFSNLILDHYIPNEYLPVIDHQIIWNPETQEHQMRGVAYTGNNMRKMMRPTSAPPLNFKLNLGNVYHEYSEARRERRERRALEKKMYSAIPRTR